MDQLAVVGCEKGGRIECHIAQNSTRSRVTPGCLALRARLPPAGVPVLEEPKHLFVQLVGLPR